MQRFRTGMLDKIATFYCGFVVKQAWKCQTWPKEERNNFLKHSYFQPLLTLCTGVWVKHISAYKQLWDEYPHQATI